MVECVWILNGWMRLDFVLALKSRTKGLPFSQKNFWFLMAQVLNGSTSSMYCNGLAWYSNSKRVLLKGVWILYEKTWFWTPFEWSCVPLSCIQLAFQYWTIWQLTSFWTFEYWISSVFRSYWTESGFIVIKVIAWLQVLKRQKVQFWNGKKSEF